MHGAFGLKNVLANTQLWHVLVRVERAPATQVAATGTICTRPQPCWHAYPFKTSRHPALIFALFTSFNLLASRLLLGVFPVLVPPVLVVGAVLASLLAAFALNRHAHPQLYGAAIGLVAGSLVVDAPLASVVRRELIGIAAACVATMAFPVTSPPPPPPPPPRVPATPVLADSSSPSWSPQQAALHVEPVTPRDAPVLSPQRTPLALNQPAAAPDDDDNDNAFSGAALEASARACAASPRDLNAQAFRRTSVQVVRLMCTLGRAFEFGKPPLEEHCAIMRMRTDQCALALALPADAVTLADLFDLSDRMGVTRLGKKAKPAPRTVLKLLVFIDFAVALCSALADPAVDVRVAAGDAYQLVFGQSHPWLLRQTVRQAMRILPARRSWEKTSGGGALECARWAEALKIVSQHVWDLLRAKGLTDLS